MAVQAHTVFLRNARGTQLEFDPASEDESLDPEGRYSKGFSEVLYGTLMPYFRLSTLVPHPLVEDSLRILGDGVGGDKHDVVSPHAAGAPDSLV
jgi:hypothetical protein